ncbi:hypothetical protein [Acidisoma cladoniae]|jgi:hypothetical protein|uniref:hypothetical protein n=1 Tax=Acidisoma cladoniae TaxID=3040935 RepID=UPI002551A733|nr:hypothetical protein [Acidisoma sp. PAMC 29798]
MSASNDGRANRDGVPGIEGRRAVPPPEPSYPLMENMFAPEVFATFASSFSVGSGSVTIKLVSSRWDNSSEPGVQRAVVVGRITMPLQGAQTLAAGLHAFLAQHGLEYAPATRPKTRASDATAFSPNSES